MVTEENQYLDTLKEILDHGISRGDRTGTGTKAIFVKQMRFNIKDKFPLLTTKKVFFRGVFEETLQFLRGDTNSKHLEDKGVNIWRGNTSREFLDNKGLSYLPEGEMGCSYPHQWRNFGGEHPLVPDTKGMKGVDQVASVIDQITNNPNSRRIYIVGSNPAQEPYMALPPCHNYAQFFCDPETKTINCFFLIRSNDMFLGFPFNLAQYALITYLIGAATGYTPNELVYTGVDVHLYNNHFEQAREQISREPSDFPKLVINKRISSLSDIETLSFDDVELIGYKPQKSITAKMAV